MSRELSVHMHLRMAKAIYTTDPNTKSQLCVHDCRPNPNPNSNKGAFCAHAFENGKSYIHD